MAKYALEKKNHLIFEFIIPQCTFPVYCLFNYYFGKKKKALRKKHLFETACIISDSGCFSMGNIIAFVKKKKRIKSHFMISQ